MKKNKIMKEDPPKVVETISNMKVQIIDPPIMHKDGEKMCFTTFHAWTHSQKAAVLERVVSNPHLKFRINFTDEEPREGEWFEEVI
jgi:hypothetical protein